MKTNIPPHRHFRQNPPVIITRKDGSLQVTYQRLLLRKMVRVLLDPEDLALFLIRPWNVDDCKILVSGYPPFQVRLHRLIVGTKAGERVRFANGNTMDFRRSNLVVGGRCRARGMYAPCIYPRYKLVNGSKGGENRIVNGLRTLVKVPGRRFYREFSFDKYGMEGAAFRALSFRVGMMRAFCLDPSEELEECLSRARRMMTAAQGEGTVRRNGKPVSREYAAWQHEEAA